MFDRAIRIATAVIMAVTILLSLPSLSCADTGSVRINIARAGFIVGVGGGSGTLRFRGRCYRLSVGGLSIGTIGAASADLVGRAYNLRTASDIVGTIYVGFQQHCNCGRGEGCTAAERKRRHPGFARTTSGL